MGARVDIKHWSYRYPLNQEWAVRDMNLTVQTGEKVLLTGPSGWGKSTVLQGIAGILGDAEDGGQMDGDITIDGVNALESRGAVGLILQDPESQIIFARVQDNASFGGENLGYNPEEIIADTAEALHIVHLDPEHGIAANRLAQQLSGGQIQRLAIASIMVMKPRVIVCDEPTANLDPDGIEDVVQAISETAEKIGATLIIVDHNADAWGRIIDRHIVLSGSDLAESTRNYAHQFAPHGDTERENSYDSVLSARELRCGYNDCAVSEPVTHDFYAGTITAITGVNGAGKTTLALTLAGLLPALSGDVSVSPAVQVEALSSTPSEWTSAELSQRIQYVFQNPEHQFVTTSVVDEMMSALKISRQRADIKESVQSADASQSVDLHNDDLHSADLHSAAMERLEYYGLAQQCDQNPFTLSGGQKRRLTVACAIEAQPKILIVDEPTYGQDPRTWLAVVTMFAQLRDNGTCVIAVTHDRDFIAALGAQEVVIEPRGHSSESERVEKLEQGLQEQSESSIVARLNPMTRLLSGLIMGLPLILSLDIVSAGVTLLLEIILAIALGFRMRTLVRYTWPVIIGALGSCVTVLIYNSQHSWILAAATALRVLAMGAPAIVLVMRMDPTDLADAFVMIGKISDRFVYAALAGFRLLPLLRTDIESIHQARTIRGIRARSRVQQLWNDTFNILVLAIRRSTMLAVVLQARGFGCAHQRTHVRTSRLTWRDGVAYAVSIAVPVIALAVAYYGGTLNLFGNLV